MDTKIEYCKEYKIYKKESCYLLRLDNNILVKVPKQVYDECKVGDTIIFLNNNDIIIKGKKVFN